MFTNWDFTSETANFIINITMVQITEEALVTVITNDKILSKTQKNKS